LFFSCKKFNLYALNLAPKENAASGEYDIFYVKFDILVKNNCDFTSFTLEY